MHELRPITFGFFSLIRALYHDFRQRYPRLASGLLTSLVAAFFLGSLALETWILGVLLRAHPLAAIVLFIVFVLPAFVGLILLVAGLVEAIRAEATRTGASGTVLLVSHGAAIDDTKLI